MIEFKAKILSSLGDVFEYPLHGLEDGMLNEELWCQAYFSGRGDHYVVPKINDNHIPERDLFELGYYRIMEITRIEIVETKTKIYSI